MAISLAIIIVLGMLSEHVFTKLKMPGLIGMILTGVLLGPQGLDMIDPALLKVSWDIRIIALIVILLRAGLKIKKHTLNKVGPTAAFMSIVPSLMEGLAITAVAPMFFEIGYKESALLGFVIAAVSPAVIVPAMIGFMERGAGKDKSVPALVLASSALDNAIVIVVFTSILGFATGDGKSIAAGLLNVPISILLGALLGAAMGGAIVMLFKRHRIRHTKKTMLIMGISVLLVWLENSLKSHIAVSSVLAVLTVGFVLLEKHEEAAHAVSAKLSKIWLIAEITLFVMIGAQVDIGLALSAGAYGAGIIFIGLIARSIGVVMATSGAGLNIKERLFCVVSYMPKATVQAAVGAMPLAAGVKGGDVMLCIAVLSILITAPIGALAINVFGERLLNGVGR